MSFEVICENCGAPSSPSVGVCNFCKSSFAISEPKNPSLAKLKKCCEEGDLDQALALAHALDTEESKVKDSISFLMTYIKLLVETEGPAYKIKSLLLQAASLDPDNGDILDYLDLMDAKSKLSQERNDFGEKLLKTILIRSPQNVHAHFILGSHLFWKEKEPSGALVHLIRAVELRPNFLRAWACLGALYLELKQDAQANQALRKCLKLESNPAMIKFFESQIQLLKVKKKAA